MDQTLSHASWRISRQTTIEPEPQADIVPTGEVRAAISPRSRHRPRRKRAYSGASGVPRLPCATAGDLFTALPTVVMALRFFDLERAGARQRNPRSIGGTRRRDATGEDVRRHKAGDVPPDPDVVIIMRAHGL